MAGGGGGGSFLGTAAAAAAGVVGGGLLMNSIRGMLGGQGGKGPFSGAFDQLSGSSGGGRAGASELSRDAGLEDIGQGRRAGLADVAQNDSNEDDSTFDDEEEDDGDFDDGSFDDDTESA